MTASLLIDADTSWLAGFKREHGERHLLAMSRGKDAIAGWLVLREHGFDVAPFHLHLVSGLRFVAESLAALEHAFGTKILDLPHPRLFQQLDNCVFQSPERVAVIDRLFPRPAGRRRGIAPTYAQVYADVRKLSGAPATSLVASGVRACDSIVRRISFQRHSHVRLASETFFPVWNFRKADVLAVMRRHGIRLPAEYAWFAKSSGKPATGRSFDGIDYRFLEPIRRHAPDDYARILEWAPLADLEIFRRGLSRPEATC